MPYLFLVLVKERIMVMFKSFQDNSQFHCLLPLNIYIYIYHATKVVIFADEGLPLAVIVVVIAL